MCINTYRYVLECIYTHYHGGYVFIWFRNFKRAYFTKRIYTQNFSFFFWKIFVGTNFFWPSLHMLENFRTYLKESNRFPILLSVPLLAFNYSKLDLVCVSVCLVCVSVYVAIFDSKINQKIPIRLEGLLP